MRTHGFTLAALVFALPVFAADPVVTDGDKYKVLLENDCVRVLEYRDEPGQITQEHQHPAFVLYALAPFERVIHLPGGKVINRSFAAGDVIWSPAQTHTGENTGSTPTHAVIVESKASGSRLSQCSNE